ncbi:hypothetical protein ACIGW0_05955 [Streptomyces bikiniensis]|uniref:Gram-positive cocci surface proteins LPxTG domain-containing protein n=1 Tax=Streptomyces bikiniensis TaxID=1896 RepID=A0ABW8CPZ0_STRBI
MASAPLRLRSVRAVTVATAVAAPFALAAPAPATVTAAPAPAATAPGPGAPAPEPPGAPRPPGAPVIPAPDPPTPSCGAPDDEAFPLDTRIHPGPAGYAAGGPFQDWRLDLTNTTGSPCSGIHPVLVLTDRDRVLRPEQIRFEFYDAGAARWHPVAFEGTSEAENVGVFTDFGGFAVPAGETLTVPVRLAFRAGTAPGEVVVNAAIVQRRGTDGDWIGDSGDHRLTVGPADPDAPVEPPGSTAPPATTAPADPAEPSKTVRPPEPSGPPASQKPQKPAEPSKSPEPSGPAVPVGPAATAGSTSPGKPTGSAPPVPSTPPHAPTRPSPPEEAPATSVPELAHTGRASDARARALAPFAVALVLLGAALVRAGRRHRRS